MIYLIPILSYLIGSIPFGLLIGKWFYKIDVRTVGSGNIGATNVSRTCSKLAGLLTFLLDFYKGIVVLIFTRIYFYPSHELELLICLAAILGHSFSIFLKFKGGKSVAISFACLVIMYPAIAINIALFWGIIMGIFATVGLASTVTATLLFFSSFQVLLLSKDVTTFAFLALVSALIIFKHLPNIKDIRAKLSPSNAK